MQETNLDDVTTCVGAKIIRANSSLRNFAIELSDGRGLLMEAVNDSDAEEPAIAMTLVKATALPALNEAVCSVDWSWIYGSTIKQISAGAKMVRFQLENIGPLNVSVGTWQGSPFLSFQPFRPAK
jgi:hypothetical protein